MELQQSIRSLKSKGWSAPRISRELGVNRRTVKRYCSDSKCTKQQTGKKGPTSSCQPYREQIEKWFESGLSIEHIHHDLTLEHDFEGSNHSVYRFVQTLEVDTATGWSASPNNRRRLTTERFICASAMEGG